MPWLCAGDAVCRIGTVSPSVRDTYRPIMAYGFEMLNLFAIFLCWECHLLIVFPIL